MKVLILAHDFPPFVSVGGLRPYSWYRYLRDFDVDPVVVTRQWANVYGDERDYIAASETDEVVVEEGDRGTLIRTPYAPNLSNRLMLRHGPSRHRLVRKLITAWYEFGQYYAMIGPKQPLYDAARAYMLHHRVDAIIATGEPFVLFKYAARLSRDFGVPWVADYRDPWSQDKRRAGQRISRRSEERTERRLTGSASVITTVSESVREGLAVLHPGKAVEVIPNGYDPDAMSAAKGCAQGAERLTIAFTGSVYGWHPLESFFRVLDGFLAGHPDAALALRMIGVGDWQAMENGLRDRFPTLARHVTFTPRLPNDEMAVELAKANAFLMFNNYRYAGTKIYDYLALKRRILLCYSDDSEARALKRQHYNLDPVPGADEHVLEHMVEATESGIIVRDAAHLGEVLADLSRDFEEHGSLACQSVGTEKYSRRAQAERLAGVLKGLVK